jgi:hypothetical protein
MKPVKIVQKSVESRYKKVRWGKIDQSTLYASIEIPK